MDVNLIKSIMKEKKMTQKDLSDITGVPLQTLKYIFTGRTLYPRIDTVEAIEKALGISAQGDNNISLKEREIVDLLMQLDEKQLEDALSVIKIIARK